MGLIYFGDFVVKLNTDPLIWVKFLKFIFKKKLKITDKICDGKTILLVFFNFFKYPSIILLILEIID
jgi:hypothetical protein